MHCASIKTTIKNNVSNLIKNKWIRGARITAQMSWKTGRLSIDDPLGCSNTHRSPSHEHSKIIAATRPAKRFPVSTKINCWLPYGLKLVRPLVCLHLEQHGPLQLWHEWGQLIVHTKTFAFFFVAKTEPRTFVKTICTPVRRAQVIPVCILGSHWQWASVWAPTQCKKDLLVTPYGEVGAYLHRKKWEKTGP